ncbi:isocitrate/isopropylmalate family dehydrogenase [Dankookia sp. P2]|uniref:isocitrate/isopropylmalate family dehydrogenase n=1 Tax=Dankookia sp. P2 TaxID=3423955 RepID=UPI003D66C2B8
MDSTPMHPATESPSRTKVKVTAIPGDGIRAGSHARHPDGAGSRRCPGGVGRRALAGAEAFKRGIAAPGRRRRRSTASPATGVALKGPLETPVGFGDNVGQRDAAARPSRCTRNIRPVRSCRASARPSPAGASTSSWCARMSRTSMPASSTLQTPGVAQCLKIITEVGCERIVRLAAAVAEAEGRKKVTVATKANIMKLTEGMLKRSAEQVMPDYPGLQHEHMIVDNCAHQMVIRPEQFDVTVMTNMNGDILSDLAAGLVGGLGVAPSANLGDEAAMFEAVHGSAPQIAGKGVANPTALLLSSLMMLRHIGDFATARRIEHALYVTLEEGKDLTGDIARDGEGAPTAAFVDRIIANLDRESANVPDREYRPIAMKKWPQITWYRAASTRELVGVDVFVESERDPRAISITLAAAAENSAFDLTMISSRGAQVWPEVAGHTFLVDHFRARFMFKEAPKGNGVAEITDLLQRIGRQHNWMHLEKLQRYDGADAYSKA